MTGQWPVMVAALYFHICGCCLIFAVKKKTMATILQQPSLLCFSSAVEDIVFSTADESGTLVLELTYGGETYEVINETMYPSDDSTITLCDLSSLLEPYARRVLQVTMNCSFTDQAGTVAIDPVTVLFSMADVGQSALEFTSTHFLTILDDAKMTAEGREERIYVYNHGNPVQEISVTAYVRMLSGVVNTLTADLPANMVTDGITQFDVSPAAVILAIGLHDGSLLSYVVESGNRRQEFRMMEEATPPAPVLLFTNSFGCQEFIYCTGTHKKDSKYDRQSTRMRGMLRNYRIVENRQFSANTGWLPAGMANWADELFRSEEVFLWDGGTPGREVVITDSKSEISNDDDHMPAFEFTYSYAQRIHNVMQPAHAGRVFDNTFDYTFN